MAQTSLLRRMMLQGTFDGSGFGLRRTAFASLCSGGNCDLYFIRELCDVVLCGRGGFDADMGEFAGRNFFVLFWSVAGDDVPDESRGYA